MAADLPLPFLALVFGLLSALSLPLGAMVGLACAPVPERITAHFMAFGSGALVFAVATQLYGQTLTRLEASMDPRCDLPFSNPQRRSEHYRNLEAQIIFGFLGALLYTSLNKWLERCAAGGRAASRVESDEEDAAGQRRELELRGTAESSISEPPAGQCGSSQRPSSGISMARMRTSVLAEPLATLGDTSGEPGRVTFGRQSSHHEQRMPGPLPEGSSHGRKVAFSMWLGVTLDGIPEALMLGFMTNEGTVSWDLLVAVFIANFPEAFSAASLLRGYNVPASTIVGMWTLVFVLTGLLAMTGSFIMPASTVGNHELDRIRAVGTAACEGLTGGAMLAMVSTAMVPEAYRHAGELSGILFVLGFLVSVWLDGVGVRYGGPRELNG